MTPAKKTTATTNTTDGEDAIDDYICTIVGDIGICNERCGYLEWNKRVL